MGWNNVPYKIKVLNGATLNINAVTSSLIIPGSVTTPQITIDAGGTLAIDGKKTFGSFSHPTGKKAIVIESTGSVWNPAETWMVNNGTFEMDGATIEANGMLHMEEAGTTRFINNSQLVMRSQITNFRPADVDIDGLHLINMNAVFEDDAITQFKDVTIYNGIYIFTANSANLPANNPFIIEGAKVLGRNIRIENFFGGTLSDVHFEFRNTDNWTGLTILNTTNGYQSLTRFTKDIKLTVFDDRENPLPNVIVFGEDYDNGGRVTYTDDEDFMETTNASGIVSGTQLIQVAIKSNKTGDTPTWDYRNAKNDATGDHHFDLWAYKYLPAEVNFHLRGNGRLDMEWVLLEDVDISETNRATVDAYTQIDDLDKLYDRAKSWKVSTTNIEYPAKKEQLIKHLGGVLDLGQMNLVVDKNATDVFSVNKTNNTITMKADALKEGEKFSSLTTTGTVSHFNGATFEIGLKDSGGTHKYIELSNLVSATVTISDGASTTLHTETNVTGTFKYDFTVPASGNAHILVTRENHSNWESDIATDQLTFKANVIQYQTSSSAENQFAMMDLAERILLHSTSINTALTGSSTTVNITTNTTTSTSATEANQEAILTILERVLLKISALRNVF